MSLARALMATQGYTSEVAQAYARALELFEGGRDLRQHYSALRGLASLYLLRMEFDKAAELGEQILAIAEQEDDPNMRVDGHLVVGSTIIFTGGLQRGLGHLEAAIGLFEISPATGRRIPNWQRSPGGLPDHGGLQPLAARFPRSRGRACARCDRPGSAPGSSLHDRVRPLPRRPPPPLAGRAGQGPRASPPAARDRDEYEFRIWSAVGSCLLGSADTNLGRLETGLDEIRKGMAAYQALVSPPFFWPMLLFLEASARGRAGTPETGLVPLDERSR